MDKGEQGQPMRAHQIPSAGVRLLDPPISIDEIETPAALIDRRVLKRNVERVANLAQKSGVSLRPHAKTHKSVHIAALQRQFGAIGCTVATLDEAEALLNGGIDDVFVCYPIVGEKKMERLIALAGRGRVATIVESENGAYALSTAAERVGMTIEVTIDVDTGLDRVGVSLGEPLDRLTWLVEKLGGLKLRGLSTHEGYVYSIPDPAERVQVVQERIGAFVAAGQSLGMELISSGATPTIFETMQIPGLTEVRPGNYVFYDAMQVGLGAAKVTDCALTIITTVVSSRSAKRAIVDAGSKTLSSDRGAHGSSLLTGYGLVKNRPDLSLVALSEEHGWLDMDPEGSGASVGERLEVIPNHACATFANFSGAYLVEDGNALETVEVSARGAFA